MKSNKTDKSIKEDMIAPMDGAPGSYHQTGPSMGGDVSDFALIGPAKNTTTNKKKKKSKKKKVDWRKSSSFASSKVLSFSDFINSQS